MLTIGSHLSIAKGFTAMGENAVKIGANTLQFFSRNPRGTKARPLDEKDIAGFRQICEENHFGRLLCHAPYILNACSADPGLRDLARDTMADDLARMEYLPGNLYNFHPGSHVKQGADAGIKMIAEMLNSILKPEQHTTVLLETMAGKGTEVGRNFEELAAIIEQVDLKDKMGICLDTCHVHDGGYDIIYHLDDVLEEFDRIIGLKRLKAIHLNDSKNPCGSHKDRHEKIGEGYIGAEALIRITRHPLLCELPFYLETPNELDGYAKEIKLLRNA
ncbi:MAG: deoxyribonuclease IV [Lachnospiraceae bacterium]|nr:deoxyribonuclease IV [Lachnospiraceae bacterium]